MVIIFAYFDTFIVFQSEIFITDIALKKIDFVAFLAILDIFTSLDTLIVLKLKKLFTFFAFFSQIIKDFAVTLIMFEINTGTIVQNIIIITNITNLIILDLTIEN